MLTFQPVSWLSKHALIFTSPPPPALSSLSPSSCVAALSLLFPRYFKYSGLPKLPCPMPAAPHLYLSSTLSMPHPPPNTP